jgi:hypothetical protein
MRKIVLLSLVLAAAFATTVSTPNLAEAGFCVPTYRCICSVPYKCCGDVCSPDPNSPLQCPQVAC